MDVDCSFMDNEYRYNIEVKCSNFESIEGIEEREGFKVDTAGRIPNHKKELSELKETLKDVQRKKGEEVGEFHRKKNMDNNLKSYLVNAHEKFDSNSDRKDINVLLVCTGNAQDLQRWYTYLYGNNELFTEDPFEDPSNYNNVVFVVLSNLYHRHHEYYNKTNIKNNWSFSDSLNIIFENPHGENKNRDALDNFFDLCPNLTKSYKNYEVPGDACEEVKDMTKIRYFVKDLDDDYF